MARSWRSYRENGSHLARARLADHYHHLVAKVVFPLAAELPRHVDPADLHSAGALGLIDAIDRYDSTRGASFETYARTRIRGAVQDALRRDDWMPRRARQQFRALQATRARLAHRLGREPSRDELAEALDWPTELIDQVHSQATTGAIHSLDVLLQEAASGRTAEPLALEPDPADVGSQAALIVQVRTAMEGLSPRERQVLRLCYQRGLTQREASRVLDLSEARVSQIHTSAVAGLRRELGWSRADD